MKPCAADTETHLIEPGLLAPPLVCLTWATEEGQPLILHRTHAHDQTRELLETDDLVLVGANMPYDMAVLSVAYPDVLPLVFNAYDANRVTDVQTRQKLIDLAKGQLGGWRNAATGVWTEFRYSLADLVMRHLGEDRSHLKSGPDVWRLRYVELTDTPLEEWPDEARDYALGDADDTLRVYNKQQADAQYLLDEYRQARAHWALHLMSCRGIRTDARAIESYRARIQAELDESKAVIIDMGWLVPKRKNKPELGLKRSVKSVHAYCEENHPDIARTPTGKPKLDEQSAKDTGDPNLMAYQHYSSSKTVMGKVEELWAGVDAPIQARFNVLVAGGRSSCRGTNIQARTRKPGDRECFVPRDGWVFLNADYDGLELRTNGQVCTWVVGYSKLADALNAGDDPHVMFASDRVGISYTDAMALYKQEKDDGLDPESPDTFLFMRQLAKMGNFGFTAGLGAAGFVDHMADDGLTVCGRPDHGKKMKAAYNKELKCHYCLTGAEALREDWFTTWPEMREYFAWVRALLGRVGHATIKHFRSERYRGMIGYTATANSFSQGLGADATKAAAYMLSRECYTGHGPLRGCYPVNYIHDEFIVEAPDDEHAHDAAVAMARIMTDVANEWLPDVPTTATPLLMRRWSKRAQPIYDSNDRLIPWDCEV